MIASIDIAKSPRVGAAGGEIRFEPSGRVVVSGPAGQAAVEAGGLTETGVVEVWSSNDWACFVGLRDVTVFAAWPREGRVQPVGELERLDLGDRYDPGGLHRVEFIELPDGDLLVVHEFGVSRVSPTVGLLWQRVHGDLTARFVGVAGDEARFVGESDGFGYGLADGTSVSEPGG